MWVIATMLLVSSCEKDPKPGTYWVDPESGAWELEGNLIPAAVKDVDGNTYAAVRIGSQVWMQQNLRTAHFPDSTPIERLFLPGELALSAEYGYLYDWATAVNGEDSSSVVQGVCPDGWHLPNRSEWEQLFAFLKGSARYYVGNNTELIAKSLASTAGWEFCSENTFSPGSNPNLNNTSCFSAYPAGYCVGNYYSMGYSAQFWSSTSGNENTARVFVLENCSPQPFSEASERTNGCSVRCVKN